MNLATLFQVIALLVGAGVVAFSGTARQARKIAVGWLSVLTVLAVGVLAVVTSGGVDLQWWYPLPALVAITTLVAVSMSSLRNTSPRTFATMLGLAAVSSSVGSLAAGPLLAAVWACGSALTLLEIRGRSLKGSRIYAIYLIPSTLLVCAALLDGVSSPWSVVALIAGVWIRMGGFPLHSWLTRFVETLPLGLVVCAMAPQVGLVLLLKFTGGSLTGSLGMLVEGLALLTALYGAVLATVQGSLKGTLAYLLMSKTGLVAFGALDASAAGHFGGLTSWIVMGLGATGFAMTIEALEARNASALSLERAGGSFESTPMLATSFLLCGLTMFGLPGTLGFIAEDLLLEAAVSDFPRLGFIIIGVAAINVFTVLRCLLTVFVGPKTGSEVDLQTRERAAMTVVLGSLVMLGLCPGVLSAWFG